MKKIVAVVLVLTLAIASCACAGEVLPNVWEIDQDIHFWQSIEDVIQRLDEKGIAYKRAGTEQMPLFKLDVNSWFGMEVDSCTLMFFTNVLGEVDLYLPTDGKSWDTIMAEFEEIRALYEDDSTEGYVGANRSALQYTKFSKKFGVNISHYLFPEADGKIVHCLGFLYVPVDHDAASATISHDNTTTDRAPTQGEITINDVTFSSGEYECPAHIVAGEYRVIPIKSGIVTVWRGDDLVMTEFLDVDDGDEIGRVVLKTGDTIKISSGKMSFEPYK